MSDGYSFHWHGVYWASLTTDGDPEKGRHDFYLGPTGADTHAHPWLKAPSGGTPVTGVQLKDHGIHIGSGHEVNEWSTEVLVRGHVQWDPTRNAVTTEIAEVSGGSAITATPVTSRRERSSRNPTAVNLQSVIPEDAQWFDFEVAWLPSTGGAASGREYVLPFGGDSPRGIRLSVTAHG